MTFSPIPKTFLNSAIMAILVIIIFSCSDEYSSIDRKTAENIENPAGSSSNGESSSSVETRCGGDLYNEETQFCHNEIVYEKCGDENGLGKYDYNPDTHFCNENNYTIAKCGGQKYKPAEQCRSGIVEGRCGGEWYSIQSEFCHDSKIYDKCGGTDIYIPSTHFCSGNAVYGKCGGSDYNPLTHFCDTRDGKSYKYVKINTQTWMAENLNYKATYSKCYGDSTGGDSQNRCDTYGRLYNWSTAMSVCPTGWHLPSHIEWQILTNFVGNPVGTKLKAMNGWNNNNGVFGGTDEFGFSALPGGYSSSTYNFSEVGERGYWWSATQGTSSGIAYCHYITYNFGNEYYLTKGEGLLHSVRCLKTEA